jgi:hypothetical protein
LEKIGIECNTVKDMVHREVFNHGIIHYGFWHTRDLQKKEGELNKPASRAVYISVFSVKVYLNRFLKHDSTLIRDLMSLYVKHTAVPQTPISTDFTFERKRQITVSNQCRQLFRLHERQTDCLPSFTCKPAPTTYPSLYISTTAAKLSHFK